MVQSTPQVLRVAYPNIRLNTTTMFSGSARICLRGSVEYVRLVKMYGTVGPETLYKSRPNASYSQVLMELSHNRRMCSSEMDSKIHYYRTRCQDLCMRVHLIGALQRYCPAKPRLSTGEGFNTFLIMLPTTLSIG
jgi:hypothetical protein